MNHSMLHMDNQKKAGLRVSMAGRAWVKQHLLIPLLLPVPEPAPGWGHCSSSLAGRLGIETPGWGLPCAGGLQGSGHGAASPVFLPKTFVLPEEPMTSLMPDLYQIQSRMDVKCFAAHKPFHTPLLLGLQGS